jgi:hypothetical protein
MTARAMKAPSTIPIRTTENAHHRLAILPGATHYDINVVPALAAAVTPFLDGA